MSIRTKAGLALAVVIAAFATWIAMRSFHSPDTPYAGLEMREIKALSARDITDLREGRGMGYALAAELNGYPGPRHVLDMAGELGLSEAQRLAAEKLFAAMKTESMVLGTDLIVAERALDESFAQKTATPENLFTLTSAASAIEGKLRATHLKYHLAMIEILSPDQVAAYGKLRGYNGGRHGGHGDGH